jgi:diguanylate cyclase (GGDEF)-like protein
MRTRGARTYLLAGFVIAAVAPMLPPAGRQAVMLAVGAAAGLAVVAGVRRHRPVRRLPWRLLLAALLVAETCVTLSVVAPDGQPFPRPVDWVYLLTYPLLIGALTATPGALRRATRSTGVVDAAIIACTAGVLSWALLVNDFLDTQRLSPSGLTLALAFPVLDLFVACAVVRMAMLGGRRNAARLLLMLGAAAMVAADSAFLHGFGPDGPGPTSPLTVAGWLLACACLSAAALHPGMAREDAPAGAHRASGRGRLLRYGLLVTVGPVATAVDVLGGARSGRAAVDVLVPLVLTAATGVLLVARSGQLAAVAQRRATDLHQRTAELQSALDSQASLQEELTHRALHDALTGLPNRVLLRERLDRALTRPGSHALLLLDLDGFKDVNDTHGHPVGDELLRVAAHRLGRVLAGGDTLARLGGDEFAVLLEDVTAEQADAVAVRVLDALREPFAVAGNRLHVTASVGLLELAGAEEADGDETNAFRDADLALYAAKGAGKNRVVSYHEGLRADHLNRTRMVERLRHALDADEFDLHYQPVVDLRTGRVVAAEALLRWFPPGEAAVHPEQIIPVAESSGLILPIGAWVLRRACAQAAAWYDAHGVRISVNVSAEQLCDAGFPAEVEQALEAAGLSARALTLEVTESMLVDPTNGDTKRAVAHLSHLRSLGVQVALDDFGTGYSSLAYLRDLPVDSLKIDRAFVPTPESPQRGQLTRAIVELGASLDLLTVAEGLETAEQAAHFEALACDLGQGYHFAEPLSAARLTEALAAVGPAAGPAPDGPRPVPDLAEAA